jgi:hypothetical protein
MQDNDSLNERDNQQPDTQVIGDIKDIEAPKAFEIEEVENNTKPLKAKKGGTVDLSKQLDPFEKQERSRMRTRITHSILSLLIIWVLLGLIYFLLTGNSFLLVTSLPMDIPFGIIVKYYFTDQ